MVSVLKLFSVRSACGLLGNLRCSLDQEAVSSAKVLVNYVQKRDDQRYKRRKTHPPIWWPKRREDFYADYLTPKNKLFVEDVIQETYPEQKGIMSPLKEPPWPRGEWQPRSIRAGVIAKKIGIYPLWTKTGRRLLTTVLQVLDNHVIRYIPPEKYVEHAGGKKYKGKFGCLVVGVDAANPQMFTSEYCGLFNQSGVMPKKKLTRFIVTSNAAVQPGTPLNAMHFRVGDYVDCYGKTIDRGFKGVMYRWGMSGGPASHGTTKAHRRVGSIGSGRTGHIWLGKKMPGHMGCERRIIQGLRVWRINTKYNIIWVQGPAVPGGVNSYVNIMDTVVNAKKPETPPPFPTFYPSDAIGEIPEELYHPELHPFSDPTIMFDDVPEIVIPTASTKKLAKTASKSKH